MQNQKLAVALNWFQQTREKNREILKEYDKYPILLWGADFYRDILTKHPFVHQKYYNDVKHNILHVYWMFYGGGKGNSQIQLLDPIENTNSVQFFEHPFQAVVSEVLVDQLEKVDIKQM